MFSSTQTMPQFGPNYYKIHVKHIKQDIIHAKTVLCCQKCFDTTRNDGP